MKKVYYDAGPDKIEVGLVGEMFLGKPVPVSDEIAAMLLKKPLFKEFKEKKSEGAKDSKV